LPTTRKIFNVGAHSADHFSGLLWTTAWKMISVVAYTAEKWSALLATTRKNG
jgi:hypothetical protein